MAILVLLVSLLCACKKDDTKTNADTTGEAQTSADGQIIENTTALPEDSTAQEGETDETQSADPAKPGETSAQVTAAPSKSTKDWNMKICCSKGISQKQMYAHSEIIMLHLTFVFTGNILNFFFPSIGIMR